MEYVMNLLAGLGDHFVLIAVGCIEAAVAAVFVGMQRGKNAKSLRKKLALAGAEQMQKEMGQAPVLMLDDVFSELDSKRQHALLSRIHGQALLTTATEPPRILECASLYQVREGQVERQK